ncbi:hypothetical protein ABH924_001731 [Arthrobacter sp. GAS37]|uniref:hypothetical protein n=1 Tax=Arthrobacter sp. GAS37 TaxID=3156261 RepID=UPI0038361D87
MAILTVAIGMADQLRRPNVLDRGRVIVNAALAQLESWDVAQESYLDTGKEAGL